MTVPHDLSHRVLARKLFISICIAVLFAQSVSMISPINLAFTREIHTDHYNISYNADILFVWTTMPSLSPSPSSSLNNTILTPGKLTTSNVSSESVLIGNEESTEPFNPGQTKITVGNTIIWINHDMEAHTVTSGSPDNSIANAKVFDSGNLNPNQTFEHTFNAAGTYKYFCRLHPSTVGLVNVG